MRPDFARAADLGVTSSAIAETLRVATLGDYDQSLAGVIVLLPLVVASIVVIVQDSLALSFSLAGREQDVVRSQLHYRSSGLNPERLTALDLLRDLGRVEASQCLSDRAQLLAVSGAENR